MSGDPVICAMMGTASAESLQRSAKSARLLNRLIKKPGNKAKEKTANADTSDVAAVARTALALKNMAIHNKKPKDLAKIMAEKERMLRIRLACEGSSMSNLAGFVTELRNAAVVIQRAWRKHKKDKYWLALERMLACEDEEAVLMEMNHWGGMSIANDNFQLLHDDNVMLVTMPEYYTGSEYDDLSCYSEYFSDDLEVDAQDIMDAAQELRDGQDELEADSSEAESLYDAEVEKRARKKARKRRRLKKKEKVLAEFEDAQPLAPTDLENQAPSIRIRRKRKKKPVDNQNSPKQPSAIAPKPRVVAPKQPSAIAPKPRVVAPKQPTAPSPKSPRPPPKKPEEPVAKPSKPGRRQTKSLDLPRQQAVVAKRERQAPVTEKPHVPQPIEPIVPAEPTVPSEPTPKPPPRNMWLRGQQGEQPAKKPDKLPQLPKHNTPNISDVKSRYMEPSPANKKTSEQRLKATAAKIAKSTPLVPTVLEPFTVSEFKRWTTSMKLRFALLRKSIWELLEDDDILGNVKQRLRTWVGMSEGPAEGGAVMGDLEVWASRVLTPTSNAAAAGQKNGVLLTEQQMEAINQKVEAFQTSLASLDKLLVVGSRVETFPNSFLDAPAVLPSSRQSVSLPPVTKPNADVASGTHLDSMWLCPKDRCKKLNKSMKDLNAQVKGAPPPGGRLLRDRHASVDGTATSATSYHERSRHKSMDGASSHKHEDFSQEVLMSFRHNQRLPELNFAGAKTDSRSQKGSKGRSLRAEVLAQQASRHHQESRRSIDSLVPQSPWADHLWGQSGVMATSLQTGDLVERSRRSLDSLLPRHPVSDVDQSIDGQHFPLPPGASKPGLPWEGLVTSSQLSFTQDAKTGYRGRRYISLS